MQSPMATTSSSSRSSRRLRAFRRWMKSEGIECSDALELIDTEEEGIAVKALCELKEGDVVAKIPKSACLTIKTSGCRHLIEAAGLDGTLGLSVAIMYERSLGPQSSWAGYLQLLPDQECLPLLWTLHEIDSLLCGTELHKVVKEDKALIHEDWKESILPLMDSDSSSTPLKLNPSFFGLQQYFAAKSLIASRSFEIDDYHGSGMVPLADLFNHKTGAEDVHFTSVSSHCESDDDTDTKNDECKNTGDSDSSTQSLPSEKIELSTAFVGNRSFSYSDSDCSSTLEDDSKAMEMIILKDVKVGAEVFNTYGTLGNAALLHRYGFTEPNNPYDIINIDLELVLEWSLSLFSSRHSRARLSMWRRLDYSGCESQNSEYFEISSDGEPQIELLVLLHVILLPEDAYSMLDLKVSTEGNSEGSISVFFQTRRILHGKKLQK